MKIGVFDSGIGGLNVLKELINSYPNNIYYYYGDTKNLPYGDKNKETITRLAIKIINFFIEKKVDLIIIACGTVSSTCFNELKQITSIPIVDILSGTINYLNNSNLKNILVFATKRTIESHLFRNSVKKEIKEVATPEFVPMIEKDEIDNLIIKKYLNNYKDIDALVLGCTHYPILKDEFKKYLCDDVLIIDMGKILVNNLNLQNSSKQEIYLYFTKIDNNLLKNVNKIINCNYSLKKIEK